MLDALMASMPMDSIPRRQALKTLGVAGAGVLIGGRRGAVTDVAC